MGDFETVQTEMHLHLQYLMGNHVDAFVVDCEKDKLWNLYLDSFPPGTNLKFRERREYDCNCCKSFIRKFGRVVFINSVNEVLTIWDFETKSETFKPVLAALSAYVKRHAIRDFYLSNEHTVGTPFNFEISGREQRKWEHFFTNLPARLVDKSGNSIESIVGPWRDTRNVFKRTLEEITDDAVETVLDLIAQNSLYRGKEWEKALKQLSEYKAEYRKIKTVAKQENYCWRMSRSVGEVVGKMRNHSIGVLLKEISAGEDLQIAVNKYYSVVDPTKLHKPKEIYSKKQAEQALKTVEELGYRGSLGRRFAVMEDIDAGNVLFANHDARAKMEGGLLDELVKGATPNAKKTMKKVEEISIDKFIAEVLPRTTSIEAYFEGRHIPNLVSLIGPLDGKAPSMFKWNNPYSWAYNGNITDSAMKERVKAAGGDVTGVLRFSIQWNDQDEFDRNDLDAHCITPRDYEIYYPRDFRMDGRTHGELDVDIRNPEKGKPAVENITFPKLEKLDNGEYLFFVENFCHRGGRGGFRAEIEFNGEIHSYNYSKELQNEEQVKVATVTYDSRDGFSIKHHLDSSSMKREEWGLTTNNFIPVSIMMYSPNYWDNQEGIGNRHFMFMLQGAENPTNPNGFFNEFLKRELVNHKRVFAALGSKMRVPDSGDQLTGLGFSDTKRNHLLVRVEGAMKRTLKIIF